MALPMRRLAPRQIARGRWLLATILIAAIAPACASAQFPEDPHPLQLSAGSNATLAALDALGELPADSWRVHAGDLAHGEAVDLDDSTWPVTSAPSVGTAGAMWFRRTIVVPPTLHGYDLTGASVDFAFDIWAQGPVPVIVYFNGRRVAMGEALEPVSLFRNAHPGDTIQIAVKALDSADPKHFAGAHLTIQFAPHRPSPAVLRLEAVSAEFLLPALAKSSTAQSQATLEDALRSVDLDALSAGRQQAFDASLNAAQAKLESLRPLLAQASFHLTGDAHIDAAWVWPWTETVDVVRRTFGTALQLMREYPGYTYSQSAAAYYEWMAEKYPALNEDLRARVREGRWEIVGGMWIEPDLNLPDGESLVRQLLVETRFFEQHYGASVHVGWNPDSFGYNWQLPQIYKKSGIDFFVTQKMDWNETNRLPLKLFYWQSPDGSRVLTYFPHNYTNYIDPSRMAEDFNVARRENPGLDDMMHLYGIGDHGGGPTRSMLDEAQQWIAPGKVFPPMKYGTAEAYFHELEPKLDAAEAPVWNYRTLGQGNGHLPEAPAGTISLPVWNDELYLEYTRGVYTSQAHEKKNIRDSERWLTDAERWAALDWRNAQPYPSATLNDAWKKALFNQFHDIAAGSSIASVYVDAERDYAQVRLATADVTRTAQADLAARIDTGSHAPAGSVPVIVWNALAWQRTGLVQSELQLPTGTEAIQVTDAEGHAVPSQTLSSTPSHPQETILFLAPDVPSMGYRVFYAQAAHAVAARELAAKSTPAEITLENANLQLAIDRTTGCITHLVDRKSGFDSIASGGCGNQLQSFVDQPKDYDAWNIDPGTLDHPQALPAPATVAVVENGPLRATVRITRPWRSSKIVQDISLSAGLDHVDLATTVDWHERHTLLKAAFPLAASSDFATYEIPYGSIQRPTTRRNSWESAKFEVPALRWADLGDGRHGLSLINDSKYGYDAKDNVLRLSLLRSPTQPDPEADQGEQHFAYSLYPHDGPWQQAQTVRRAREFNDPLVADAALPHPGTLPNAFSWVSLEPANLTLTAAKKAEDGDGLLLRFYEWAGKSGTAQLHVPAGATGAVLTNLMEKPDSGPLPLAHDTVTVPYGAFGIVTVLVRYAPAKF